MATLTNLRRAAEAAAPIPAQLNEELRPLVTERAQLTTQIDGATLETDSAQLAAWQARRPLVEREIARLTQAREAATQAASQAQHVYTTACFELERAQNLYQRLITCAPDDIDVQTMSIGRWRETLIEYATAIRTLSGALVEVPTLPPIPELMHVG